MTKWSMKLRRSGYPASVRHQLVKTAMKRWEKMCSEEDRGVRPIHRSRSWKAKERLREKERKATSWQPDKSDLCSPDRRSNRREYDQRTEGSV